MQIRRLFLMDGACRADSSIVSALHVFLQSPFGNGGLGDVPEE